jgi:uncharacterized membrane protein YhhN
MSKEFIIISISLGVICLILLSFFLVAFYKNTQLKALIIKGFASVCFLGIGAITCFTTEFKIYKLLIFIGLAFGLIGDEVIHLCQVKPKHDSLFFIGGGANFVVGHILYIIALFMLGGVNWIALLSSFVVIAIFSTIYSKHKQSVSGDMKIPLILYLGIVIFMAALAIGIFTNKITIGTGMFAVGGTLFAISDNVLFAYKLGKNSRFSQNILLHIAYYLAQILIALSICWL